MEDLEGDKEVKLIDIIREKRILYDKRVDSYRNKIKKTAAWEEVAKGMNLTATECRNLCMNLRSQYHAHRRKLHKPSGSSSGTRPYFRHEEAMRFLGDALDEEKTFSNVSSPSDMDQEETDETDADDRAATPIPPAVPVTDDQDHRSHAKNIKKRKLDPFDEEMLKLLKGESKDEFDVFGNLVVVKLRKLNEEDARLAREVQVDISTLIWEYEKKLDGD